MHVNGTLFWTPIFLLVSIKKESTKKEVVQIPAATVFDSHSESGKYLTNDYYLVFWRNN